MTTFIALFVIFYKKVFLYRRVRRFFFISLLKNKHFYFWFSHVLRKELLIYTIEL